jgi:glutathione synthase/RimK-type ligase-like ATP-grasp enzyme
MVGMKFDLITVGELSSAGPFVDQLRKAGVEVNHINLADLDAFEIEDWNLAATDMVWVKGLSLLHSVWFNRLVLDHLGSSEIVYNHYLYTEYVYSIESTIKNKLRSFDGHVINPPLPSFARVDKIENLAIASSLGLNTPDTLVSANLDKVQTFAEDRKWSVVLKTHHGFDVKLDDSTYAIPVTRLAESDVKTLREDGVPSPLFIQEFIPKKHEIRVVQFGDFLHAFKIDTLGIEEASTDYRIDDLHRLHYEQVDIPKPIEVALLKLLTNISLHLSTVDFVVDHDGEWFFLEVNRDGEWLWLEHATGVPLTSYLYTYIAELLTPASLAKSTR